MDRQPSPALYGDIALIEGLLTREQLDEGIRIQERSLGSPALGEILLDLGFLTPQAHARILELQRQAIRKSDDSTSRPGENTRVRNRLDNLFGKLAVSLGFTAPARIHECVRIQAQARESGSKIPLGRLLVDKGYLDEAQVLTILHIQENQIVGCPPCGKWYRAEGGKAPTACKHCGKPLHPATEMGALDPREILAGAAETLDGGGDVPPDITQYVDETRKSLPAVGADLRVRPVSIPTSAHLGRLAVEMKFITQFQLDESLALQRKSQPPKPLGRVLQERGYLSPDQVSRLLVEQERRLARDGGLPAPVVRRTQIGELAVQQGFLTRDDLNRLLREQARNAEAGYKQPIGRVLVEKGVLTSKDAEHLGRRQRRMRRIASVRGRATSQTYAVYGSVAAALLLGFLFFIPPSKAVQSPVSATDRRPVVRSEVSPPEVTAAPEIREADPPEIVATAGSREEKNVEPHELRRESGEDEDAAVRETGDQALRPVAEVPQAAQAGKPLPAPAVMPVKVDTLESPFDLIEDPVIHAKAAEVEKQGRSALRDFFGQIRKPESPEARLRSLEISLCMSDRVTGQIVALSPRSRWPAPPRAKIVPDGPGHTSTFALPSRDAEEGPDYALAGRFELVTNWFPDRFRLDVGGLEPGRARMKFIIIHTAEGTKAGTIAWFRNPKSRASAHYVVGLDGEVVQMVAEADTAFHGGGATINPYSIGIEHEGYAHRNTWTRPQVLASALLVRYLCAKYRMPVERTTVIGHYETEPRTRTDPGPHFKWADYLSLVRGVGAKQ